MKIHYKDSDPSTPTKINHNQGDPDESFFDHTQLNPDGDPVDGELIHGNDPSFYDIIAGALAPKSTDDVNAIKSARASAAQQVETDRASRRAIGKGHAQNGTPDTQPGQQASIDLLFKILDDEGRLD